MAQIIRCPSCGDAAQYKSGQVLCPTCIKTSGSNKSSREAADSAREGHLRVACPSCSARLKVAKPDAGKKCKCPKCQLIFLIDAAPKDKCDEFISDTRDKKWFVIGLNGEKYGPVSRLELDAWVAEGRINADCKLYCEGGAPRPAAEIYAGIKSGIGYQDARQSPTKDVRSQRITTDFTTLTPYQFEQLIGDVCEAWNLDVTVTKQSGDGGVDVRATSEDPLTGGRFVVQCKLYSEHVKVGEPAVRDLYGVVMDERANKGILITTSDFTSKCREWVKGKPIRLINGEELRAMIDGINDAPRDATRLIQDLAQYAQQIEGCLWRINNVKNYSNDTHDYITYTKCVTAQSQTLLSAIHNFDMAIRSLLASAHRTGNRAADPEDALEIAIEAVESAMEAARITNTVDPPPELSCLKERAVRPFCRVLWEMGQSIRRAILVLNQFADGTMSVVPECNMRPLNGLFDDYNTIVNEINARNNSNQQMAQAVGIAGTVVGGMGVVALAGLGALASFERRGRRRRRW